MMLNSIEEVLIVCIWDKTDEVYTRSIVVDRKSKQLKFKGKKPNKIIVPESMNDKKLMKVIKSIGSYGCVIVKAKGK